MAVSSWNSIRMSADMDVSKSILIVMSRFPYPPVGGEKNNKLNMLRLLSKHYFIHLVCLTNVDLKESEIAAVSQYTKSIKVFKKTKLHSLLNCFRSTWNFLPLQINYFYFSDVQEYVNNFQGKVFASVSALIRTAKYLENFKCDKKILEMSDSIAANYLMSVRTTKSLPKKLLYFFEGHLLKTYEQRAIGKFDTTLFFNYRELDLFQPKNKLRVLPHGVNDHIVNYNRDVIPKKDTVCFLGKMDYQPNVDAVVWFVDNVLPILPENIKFKIIGAQPSSKVLGLAKKYPSRVEVTGFVEDPYYDIKACLCVVAPMLSAAGIQNKVLEAMAVGQVVVSSSVAIAPLRNVQAGQEILQADTPKQWSEKINWVADQDEEHLQEFKKRAKEYIKSNYSWEAYEKVFLEVLS